MEESVLNRPISLNHIDILRDMTQIGEYISFSRNDVKDDDKVITNTYEGVVVKKFPHIFLLDNGRSCSWKDYMLGCSTDIRRHVFELEGMIKHGLSI